MQKNIGILAFMRINSTLSLVERGKRFIILEPDLITWPIYKYEQNKQSNKAQEAFKLFHAQLYWAWNLNC